MARVAIDCDGVLADFVRAFNVIVGLPPEFEPDNWDYRGVLTKKEIEAGFYRAKRIPNWFTTLEPHRENVAQLVRWLGATKGHDVWIVTSRFETSGMSAAWQTEWWARACGIKGYENYLGVVTVPLSEDKVDICSRLNVDWMVDDKIETIESFDRFPYFRAALMDRPWNQGAEVKWRVKDMEGFLNAIPNA